MKTNSIQGQAALSPVAYPDAASISKLSTKTLGAKDLPNSSSNTLATSPEPPTPRYGSVSSFVSFLKALRPSKDLSSNISYSSPSLNQHVLKTRDGFELTVTGSNQEVIIKSPSGAVTRIWGDPHVEESDGDKWDFDQRSTFIAGDNKITIETTPPSGGKSFVSAIHVYNRDTRISIGGISENNPTLEEHTGDALTHDITLEDGHRFSFLEIEPVSNPNNKFRWQKVS